MPGRPETIDETARLVTERGGRGIAVRVDHTVPAEVARLFEQVGELDLLVNDVWGGDDLVEWGKRLWEARLEDGLTLLDSITWPTATYSPSGKSRQLQPAMTDTLSNDNHLNFCTALDTQTYGTANNHGTPKAVNACM